MSAHQPLDTALALRLELVVELVSDPLAHLRGERLGVEPGGQPLDERHEQHCVAQVASRPLLPRPGTGSSQRRHRRRAWWRGAPGQSRPRRTPARRTRRTPGSSGAPNSRRISFSRSANATGGTLSRSAASLCCSSSRWSSGRPSNSTIETSGRPSSPRRASAQAGRRAAARAAAVRSSLGGGGPLGRSHPVRGSHPGPAQALPRHQPADARRPRKPAAGQLSRFRRRIVGLRAHRPSLASRPHRQILKGAAPAARQYTKLATSRLRSKPARADVGGRTPRLLLRFAGGPEASPCHSREGRSAVATDERCVACSLSSTAYSRLR